MNYRKRRKISLAVIFVSAMPIIAILIAAAITLALRPKHQSPVSSPFWSKYGGLSFVAGIACFVLGAAFVWIWEFQARAARKSAMRKLAERLNFTYIQKMSLPYNLKAFRPFNEFEIAYPNISNVLRGAANGSEVWIFDYRHSSYLSAGGLSGGNAWTFIDTFIVIISNNNPKLFAFDEGLEIENIEPELKTALEKSGLMPARRDANAFAP
jgi:hypothetical protein